MNIGTTFGRNDTKGAVIEGLDVSPGTEIRKPKPHAKCLVLHLLNHAGRSVCVGIDKKVEDTIESDPVQV